MHQPFVIFSNEARHELKKSHPGLDKYEVLRRLSAQWKELDLEKKKSYYRLKESTIKTEDSSKKNA